MILLIVLIIKISALIFKWFNLDPHPHLVSAFGIRIQETKTMRFNVDVDSQHCFNAQ
jgi:hypothetical protein